MTLYPSFPTIKFSTLQVCHTNVTSSHSHQPQNEAIPGHQSGDFSILRAASTSNCLRAYRSLLGFAGVSAHCLAALRWGLKQMTVKGRKAGGWGLKDDWEGRKRRVKEGGEGA